MKKKPVIRSRGTFEIVAYGWPLIVTDGGGSEYDFRFTVNDDGSLAVQSWTRTVNTSTGAQGEPFSPGLESRETFHFTRKQAKALGRWLVRQLP